MRETPTIRVPVPSAESVVKHNRRLPEVELVEGSATPQRKWFAAAIGALGVQGLAAIGVDVGELGSSVSDLLDLGLEPDAIEAATRTAIGALAAHYLWPEWLSLPQSVRALGRKILRKFGR